MCVVSMVMDDFHRKWSPYFPNDPHQPLIPVPMTPDRSDQYPWPMPGDSLPKSPTPVPVKIPDDILNTTKIQITVTEWLEYQRLKQAAREKDIRENNPDCQKPELEAWEREFVKHLVKTGILKEEHVLRGIL